VQVDRRRGVAVDVARVGRKLIQSLGKSPGLSALPADRLVKFLDKLPSDVRPEADLLLKRSNFDLEGQHQRLEELKDALVGGDADHGRALFFGSKATCSACHRIGDQGGNIGPNLAGIGEIRTRRDLLEAVAFPSASFARNFEPYTVITKSGMAQSGIISRTSSDAIYLTTGERTTIRIPRSEIEDDGVMPAKVSIMPQGLDRILQPTELKDLLAFLSSLRDQKKP
jgi:putative heme-binding domain-containing protein